MLTSCHHFTAETSSWHDFIPGPWISGSVAYGAPLLDANLRGLCTNSWLCSGQHVTPWESMVALPWSLLTKHRKFRPRSQLFDLYGSLAVIFIIFMSCRLRILGNAKHLGFWETWAYLSFIRFIVGTRGSQSCTRIMHVYFAGIPGNFRWRTACRNTCLLICPGMSKHPWLYGYSPEAFWEIEWSQLVRFIRIDSQRAMYHLYDHFVAVSVRSDCSFSDFLPPSLFDCYGDSVHRYLLHGKWKWKPTFGLELEDRVLRKPLILR